LAPSAGSLLPLRHRWISTLALAGTLAGALIACDRPLERQPPLGVQVEPVQQRSFHDTLETVSTLEASEEVELASQAGGRVQQLLVRSGQAVRAGQLLLVLDQAQLRAEVAALRARAERDRANDERFQLLVRQGAATALQRDEYRAAAIASREELRARLADLAYKDVRAPIDGVLGDLTVKAGDVLQAGTPFSRLIRNQRLLARIDIPANQAERVQPGQRVELSRSGEDTPLASGRLVSLDPAISPTSQTLLAKAAIANPSGQLRNGQRLRTRVVLAEGQRPAVPFSAVSRQSGQAFVFVQGTLADLRRDPGQAPLDRLRQLPPSTPVALQRAVRLGPLQGSHYPVLAGLEPGALVIRSNLPGLRHGLPVKAMGSVEPALNRGGEHRGGSPAPAAPGAS
jgi:RND family efflux transporter MFP subunit